MVTSATPSNERKTWIYAFAILLLVTLWILSTRLSNSPFLALDFEIIVVYLPTTLAGIIALYVAIRSKRGS
jgi:protein-S-isoprenylcysteine O-methyltransferase Ste14